MSRAGRRLPALVRISKYAEKLPEIIFGDMSKFLNFEKEIIKYGK